jgi:thiol-disulfide isomerase/thioredoxin
VLDRLLFAVGLILLGWAAYRLVNAVLLRRRATQALGLPGYQLGRPAILYFTTPGCVPCRTIQRPALEALMERYGNRLQILEVDASEDQALAIEWGVLSVPTTFLIDAAGRARGVNHGVARAARLAEQLTAIGAAPGPAGVSGQRLTQLPAADEAAAAEGR